MYLSGSRRYLVHAMVLIAMVCLSTLGGLPGHLRYPLPIGALGIDGGEVGQVQLSRNGGIVQAIQAPAAAEIPHRAIHYTVQTGEDLTGIAEKLHLTPNAIRWSTPALTHSDVVHPGQVLVAPPVEGLVATVTPGATVAGLAKTYHLPDPNTIIDFNLLLDPTHLTLGSELVIPGGRGPELFPRTALPGQPHMGPYDNSSYTFGQCTYFAASWAPVGRQWGNAWQWYSAAQHAGWRTTPAWAPNPGDIIVTWDNVYYGHVAYVYKVYSDQSIDIWEMNFAYWDKIDARHLSPDDYKTGGRLIGFITPP